MKPFKHKRPFKPKPKAEKLKEKMVWVKLQCPTELSKMKYMRSLFHPYKILDMRPDKNKSHVKLAFEKNYVARRALQSKQQEMIDKGIHLVDDSQKLIDPLEDEASHKILQTGRLFIRHLPFSMTEAELKKLFEPFGFLTDVTIAFDGVLKRGKGFGFVTFLVPQDAVKAYKALQKHEIDGRKINILPGEEAPEDAGRSSFHTAKRLSVEEKRSAHLAYNWNTLFLAPDTVANIVAQKSGITLAELYQSKQKDQLATQLSIAEVEIVSQMRQFLLKEGISPEAIRVKPMDFVAPRSKFLVCHTFIWKDLPPGTGEDELREMLGEKLSEGLTHLMLLPFGVAALLTFDTPKLAKKAFNQLANEQFKDRKILLQWVDTLEGNDEETPESDSPPKKKVKQEPDVSETPTTSKASTSATPLNTNTKLLVRNIPFSTTESDLRALFSQFGKLANLRMPKAMEGKCRGFAFVNFETTDEAQKALDAAVSLHLLGRKLQVEFATSA